MTADLHPVVRYRRGVTGALNTRYGQVPRSAIAEPLLLRHEAERLGSDALQPLQPAIAELWQRFGAPSSEMAQGFLEIARQIDGGSSDPALLRRARRLLPARGRLEWSLRRAGRSGGVGVRQTHLDLWVVGCEADARLRRQLEDVGFLANWSVRLVRRRVGPLFGSEPVDPRLVPRSRLRNLGFLKPATGRPVRRTWTRPTDRP